jgi:hypothetical protein
MANSKGFTLLFLPEFLQMKISLKAILNNFFIYAYRNQQSAMTATFASQVIVC